MWVLVGAVTAVAASFPIAALSALVFRFPVPFAGYMSGPEAVLPALSAVLFYGMALGGFLVQAFLGGLAGLVAQHRGSRDRKRTARLCLVFSVLGSACGVLTLSVLDKIIGPW
ncbi:MAG: hypothetical protein HY317_00510 [Acidobacteria bacterium]|nr:hypothetical protein [Acidobacteriota bacterium]